MSQLEDRQRESKISPNFFSIQAFIRVAKAHQISWQSCGPIKLTRKIIPLLNFLLQLRLLTVGKMTQSW